MRTERMYINDARKEGLAKGLEQGREQGREEERQKALDEKRAMARTLRAGGVDIQLIKQATGFTEDEIEGL